MMGYTLQPDSSLVCRDIDGALIPPDPANHDWLDYQAWLAAGHVANSAPVPNVSTSLKTTAQMALDGSDRTILRCVEASLPVPPDWRAYRVALRKVLSGEETTLPARPDYPPGT